MMTKIKSMTTKKKILLGVILLAILAVGTLLLGSSGKDTGPTYTETAAMKGDIETYYSFTGNIESHNVQNVVAKSTEPVKNFYVKEGDSVKAGDLLYDVDSSNVSSAMTQAQTSLSGANTSLSSAKLNYERTKSLYEIGGVSAQELENTKDSYTSAQNQLKQAESGYTQAQEQYEDTRCYAEVDGEVTKIYVNENQSLSNGDSIMDIVDYDNLEVVVKIDEYDLATVTEGMEAKVAVESIGVSVVGKVSEIAKEATVESGVAYFEATIVLEKNDSLRVGLSAEVQIYTQSVKDVVTVPVNAIVYEGETAYVQYYGSGGQLEKKAVTVGINNGMLIEIKEGLAEGDAVLVTTVSASTDQSGEAAGGMSIMPSGGGGMPSGGGGGGGMPGGGGGGGGSAPGGGRNSTTSGQ